MPGPLSSPKAKKAGALRKKAVSMHRKFLKERRAGLTKDTTRKSSDINKAKPYDAGTIPSRRRKQLEYASK